MTRICDYEGSRYRTDFWEGQNRAYEDRVERVALQNLLPPQGEFLIDVGAGFGRLADLYEGYQQVVLMDYARTQLEQAQDYVGNSDRFIFVVADVYHLPFVDNRFDALAMIRVMHHLANVPAALAEIYRVMAARGTAVIEHASKFHLKSVARWLLGRQSWSPFDREPVEFVDLNFDFHPAWVRRQLKQVGFEIRQMRALSYYRLDFLKRNLPTAWLVALDSLVQPTGNWVQLSPSIFLQAITPKIPQPPVTGLFRCPLCYATEFSRQKLASPAGGGDLLVCPGQPHGWAVRNGIYDFKTPVILT